MNEDRRFNAFIKARLEEDVAIPQVTLVCQKRHVWRRPMLLAASLAVVCSMAVWRFHAEANRSFELNTVAAIDLLEESDGVANSQSVSASLADRLLAWQDAPYLASCTE